MRILIIRNILDINELVSVGYNVIICENIHISISGVEMWDLFIKNRFALYIVKSIDDKNETDICIKKSKTLLQYFDSHVSIFKLCRHFIELPINIVIHF